VISADADQCSRGSASQRTANGSTRWACEDDPKNRPKTGACSRRLGHPPPTPA